MTTQDANMIISVLVISCPNCFSVFQACHPYSTYFQIFHLLVLKIEILTVFPVPHDLSHTPHMLSNIIEYYNSKTPLKISRNFPN